MKNLLNNISQEEKERILEMHKKNITVISEQQEPTVTKIDGVDYFNPNITSEAKLNAFLDTGNLTKMNFPSLAKRWDMIINQTEDNDRINAISRTFDSDKIKKFVKNFLSFVAQQKRNPVETSTIENYFKGPLKSIFDWFSENELKDKRGKVIETYYAVINDNLGEFCKELMNIVNQQTAKAKRY
jgi:hypothetical protein